MGRVLAWAVLLACVASVGILPSAAVAVDEYVMAKIECPEKTVMKRNWKDKIGADPTFSVAKIYEKVEWYPSFKKSGQSGQMITCIYGDPNHPDQPDAVQYMYKVKRKILGCTGMPGRILECKLKKD